MDFYNREIESAISAAKIHLKSEWDRTFLQRMYAPGLLFYVEKLKGLGFIGYEKVLDAGCGFGQWSVALSNLNQQVVGIDANQQRVDMCYGLGRDLEIRNIEFLVGSIDALCFPNDFFDAVFCYSVVYYTEFHKSFREFYRILKPMGRLYVCTNGLGWYIHNLLKNHHPAIDFNPRRYAIETLWHSIRFYTTGYFVPGRNIVMSVKGTLRVLKELGFTRVFVLHKMDCYERICAKPTNLYKPYYCGMENVFEILGIK